MLSIKDEKEQQMSVMKVPLPGGGLRTISRPPAIIPHADPPPPTHDAAGQPIVSETGPSLGRRYLERQQLERHPDPTIGVVQGPRYAETGFFRRDMHRYDDPNEPLLAGYEAMQQEAQKPVVRSRVFGNRQMRLALRPVKQAGESVRELHVKNSSVDFDVEALSEETRLGLEREGVDLELMGDYLLAEEGE